MRNCGHFIVSAIIMLLIGCGSGGTQAPTTENITISGTLATGTVAGMVTKQAAAEGYSVVVLDNSSNRTYTTASGADGSFSLEVPADGTYLISLVNEGSYVGPTVFAGSGDEVTTGIAPSTNADLGSITVDAANGYAMTDAAPDSTASSATAAAVAGRPLGAGNNGKTPNSGITNREDSDEDRDGIPNLFDADEDNDGIRNGIASASSTVEVVSDYISQVYYSSNIWAIHGEVSTGSSQAEIAANEIALRLHVIPETGQEAAIQAVQCTSVPSSIATSATVRWADSLADDTSTYPLNYPAEHSAWSGDGYNLYKTVIGGTEQWIVSIKPASPMNVGDTFTIRVTYTDSTYEDFFITLPYFMTDWARIITYDGTTLTDATATRRSPANTNDDALTIVFSKPLDEDGNVLAGLSYPVVYGESDCSTGTCSVPSSTTETSVTDSGGSTLSFDVPTTGVGTTYYVVPIAQSADGQRNGEEAWFTRQ